MPISSSFAVGFLGEDGVAGAACCGTLAFVTSLSVFSGMDWTQGGSLGEQPDKIPKLTKVRIALPLRKLGCLAL